MESPSSNVVEYRINALLFKGFRDHDSISTLLSNTLFHTWENHNINLNVIPNGTMSDWKIKH